MKIKNKIIIGFIVMISILTINIKVYAASASLSASSTSITTGTEVTVSANVSGAVWNVNISGPVSNSFAATTDDAENHNTTAGTVKFSPTSAGSYTFYLSGTVADKDDTQPNEVTDSVTINVTEKQSSTETPTNTNEENTQSQSNEQEQAPSQETPEPQEPAPQAEEPKAPVETKKSSNANLSNLGIRPNDFKGFKPGTLDYSVNVPNNVEKINVYATAQDKNAKIISGTGSQNLNVGNNAIKVVVRAEDGTEKTYTINVAREEKKEEENKPENEVAEETTVENVEENQVKSDLVKLEIEGQKLTPSFSADIYEYKLNVSKDVESLNVITEGVNENINIEVAGNKEIKEGENLITILVYNNETKQNSTYQIIVNKASAEATETEDVNPILNSTIKKAKRNRYIVIGIGAFILVCIIVFIIAKNRNQDEDDEEYDEDEDNNETNHDERINLSEEEGLFRRVNREDFKLESKTSQKSINNENQEKITSKANFEKNPNDLEDRDIKRKGKHF